MDTSINKTAARQAALTHIYCYDTARKISMLERKCLSSASSAHWL